MVGLPGAGHEVGAPGADGSDGGAGYRARWLLLDPEVNEVFDADVQLLDMWRSILGGLILSRLSI